MDHRVPKVIKGFRESKESQDRRVIQEWMGAGEKLVRKVRKEIRE